jgi:cephalosporin-C deacetylase
MLPRYGDGVTSAGEFSEQVVRSSMTNNTGTRRSAAYDVTVAAERPQARYAVGEPVTFLVRVLQDNQPVSGLTLEWRLTLDGVLLLNEGTVVVDEGVARIIGSLDAPGFLRVHVSISGRKREYLAAVAVDPCRISTQLIAPDDFGRFWQEKKEQLAQIPLHPRLTPVSSDVPAIAAYDVQVDCIGAPVRGYLAYPTAAAAKSLPAIITLHSAGVRSAAIPSDWAKEGMLAFDVNAHGIPNGQQPEYYKALAKRIVAGVPVPSLMAVVDYMADHTKEVAKGITPEIPSGPVLGDYRIAGAQSRETFYYLGLYLRVLRAIDFVASRPEWDGRTLVLYGSSQGGAQALVGAALDSRVSFYVALKPSMGDINGRVKPRIARWLAIPPTELQLTQEQWEQRLPRVWQTMSYFDVANMATFIKAPGYFNVGYLDDLVPPTTVYAVYNRIKGEKRIMADIEVGHQNTEQALKLAREAVFDHMSTKKQIPKREAAASDPKVYAGTGGQPLMGKLAIGTPSDVIIQNNKLQMMIAVTSEHPHLPGATVGKPIDMAVTGMEDGLDWINLAYLSKERPVWFHSDTIGTVQGKNVRIVKLTDDEAIVEADSIYKEIPEVTLKTAYTIHPDEEWIYTETTIYNPLDKDLTLWAGDVMDNDNGDQYVYIPGVGDIGPETMERAEYKPSAPWVGHYGDAEQGYAFVYDERFSDFICFNANNTLMTQKQITIPAKGEYSYGRYIVAVSAVGRAHKMDAVIEVYKKIKALN